MLLPVRLGLASSRLRVILVQEQFSALHVLLLEILRLPLGKLRKRNLLVLQQERHQVVVVGLVVPVARPPQNFDLFVTDDSVNDCRVEFRFSLSQPDVLQQFLFVNLVLLRQISDFFFGLLEASLQHCQLLPQQGILFLNSLVALGDGSQLLLSFGCLFHQLLLLQPLLLYFNLNRWLFTFKSLYFLTSTVFYLVPPCTTCVSSSFSLSKIAYFSSLCFFSSSSLSLRIPS